MAAIIRGRQDQNQWINEIRASAGMFKGFIASFMLTQSQALSHEWARSRINATAQLAALIASMTLMGMLTLQMKQLVNTKDALPMNPFTRAGLDTWIHAMLTSGSFGIFGDFLNSDLSGFGHGALETLAGPAGMLPFDVFGAAWDAAKGRLMRGGQHPKPFGEVFSDSLRRSLQGNTPLLSTLWYARAAYQRLLLDPLQYAMDREAHMKWRRSEDRQRKETGQYMWWRSGEMLPSRLPRLVTPTPPN
jgi:hypothetical protein